MCKRFSGYLPRIEMYLAFDLTRFCSYERAPVNHQSKKLRSFPKHASPDLPDLKRFFYCFKFYKTGPFQYHPLSFAIIGENGQEAFHCRIQEDWEQAPRAERACFADSTPILRRDQIKSAVARFIGRGKDVELWSFQDVHYRHMFAELYGGMDKNFARNLGADHVMFRDMQHIYVGLGRPKQIIGQQREENRFDALATAYWGRRAFRDLKRMVQTRAVNSIPITENPEGLQRFFYDFEYWRKAPNVVLPLSIGIISLDGKKKLYGIFKEHLDAFLNFPVTS